MLSVYYITRNTLYLRCKGRAKPYRWLLGAREVTLGAGSCAVAALCGHRYGRSYGHWRGAVDFMLGKTGRIEGGPKGRVADMPDRISVVIPVYNCGPYLDVCLDSLEAQTPAKTGKPSL